MSGEWQGWQNWTRYKEAGIVEDAVDFSEEAIIVDHAVGRTKDAIGKCWPMDAAVAYTLMKGGPDAALTWRDMVNTYTRAAAVMMTGKVGYGVVPTPDTPSCGHDEIEGYLVELGEPKISSAGALFLASSYGYRTLGQWLDDLDPLHYEAHDLDAIKKKYTGIRMNKNMELPASMLVTDEWFSELLALLVDAFNRGDDEFDTPKVLKPLKISTATNMIRSRSKTYGECKWKGSDKVCLHHDRPTSRMWSMIRKDGKDAGMSGYHTAWNRSPCGSGDNYNQWNFSMAKITPKNVVAWDTMRRGMAQAIPENTVIEHIRESLTRMLKRNDNIVSKTGRGKNSTHRWSDWGWLAEMSAYVKNTSSKNRKAGDVENGWVYTKVRARKSYGHEIADFVWRPKEQIKDYVVGRQEPTDYYTSGIMQNMRFPTKEACKKFMETIAEAHIDAGGHYANRTHDGLEKNEAGKWSIRSIEINMTMHGRIDPDDYLSPQEVVTMWRHAAPAVLAEHKSNFEKSPQYIVKQAPPTTTEGVTNG